MSLVVDASVAFKWFVPEPDSAAALALLDQDVALWAPDLIFAEVGNAMWVRLRRIEGGAIAAAAAQDTLRGILTGTVSAPTFVRRATELGFELGHAVYDCVYLAMCEREEMTLVTADKGLVETVRGTAYEPLVRELA